MDLHISKNAEEWHDTTLKNAREKEARHANNDG